jgi:hypothetical protein
MSQESQIVNYKGSRLPRIEEEEMATPVHTSRVFIGELSLIRSKIHA